MAVNIREAGRSIEMIAKNCRIEVEDGPENITPRFCVRVQDNWVGVSLTDGNYLVLRRDTFLRIAEEVNKKE